MRKLHRKRRICVKLKTKCSRAEGTLRDLGTRGDIIKTMHRALDEAGLAERRRGARHVMHGVQLAEPVIGRVLSKGLAGDELGERVHLVIDGIDGRIHHMEVDAARSEEIGRGMIVGATSPPRTPRAADRNIPAVTNENGVYSPSEHLEVARAQAKELRTDPEMFVKAHVRRLEALRRAGIVERIHAEHWAVPADLPERGLAHDLKRDGRDARLKLLSPIPLSQQVAHGWQHFE